MQNINATLGKILLDVEFAGNFAENTLQIAAKNWYQHMPEEVSTSDNGNFETLWEVEIDGTIRYNTPNITIKEKEARKSYFIEVFLPEDHCINVKENEKIDKN